jgi:tRNA modification GTPase
MSQSSRDTIFALSSGRPPAAIAVIRISGPRAGAALTALGVKIPEPRKAGFARIRDPQSNEVIDEGLALWFPAPRSETGEDVAELQPHGGRAVIAAVLKALSRVEGLRPAEAGEFTRRAFENGKLDLTAVEGLADLVMAETEGQRRQAYRQMSGALGKRAEAWRETLIRALALIEARIDFSDEADVPEDLVAPALALVRDLEGGIAGALADGGRGERLREGVTVAIAGPPNAGKSTLLNRIARREAAIVSPYAGTTRDVIEVHLDLGGLPVTLLDTAGIRETSDPLELEGVRRARERAAAADLVLWVVDASAEDGPMAEPGATEAGAHCWLVRNKMDRMGRAPKNEQKSAVRIRNEYGDVFNESLDVTVKNELPDKSELRFDIYEYMFAISAVTGEGFDALLANLANFAARYLSGAESAVVTRERHRRALEDTLATLRRALAPGLAGHEDLLAEELRTAGRALGRLTGRVDVEDVLDVIFRDFCIGK